MKTASAKLVGARISLKHAVVVCKVLKGKKLSKAKELLQNLLDKKESIGGKYYTKTCKTILQLLSSAESNARQKDLVLEKTFIKKIKADKGRVFIRPKSRAKFRGRKAKVTNIEIMLEER